MESPGQQTITARRVRSRLARLFWRSRWTLEDIAIKEDKRKSWVSYRLRFGRLLASVENSTNCGILTEGRFLKYWNQTDQNSLEAVRFREVARLVEHDMNQGRDTNTNPVNAAIREAFGDGKWHAPDATARRVAADQLDVERLLTAATHNRDPAEVDL